MPSHKLVRLIWQIPLKMILWFIFGIAGYLFAALVLSVIPTYPSNLNCSPDERIFVSSNGVHLDIIIPVEELHPELKRQLELPSGTKYVSFGWGDKEFYINTPEWSDLTFPVAFRAVFMRSETAMHVTLYNTSFAFWRKMELCPAQTKRLNEYIFKSFALNSNKRIVKLTVSGYGSNDFFYLANGSFSLFKTCNIWVNKAFKTIKIKTSVWSPFDFGILFHLPE